MLTTNPKNSLHHRLMLIILLITGVVTVLITSAFMVNQAVNFHHSVKEEMVAAADILGTSCSAALMFNDRDAAVQGLSAARANPRVIEVSLLTADNRPFASFRTGIGGAKTSGRIIDQAEVDRLLERAREDGSPLRDMGTTLVVARSVTMDDSVIGTVVVEASMRGLFKKMLPYFPLAGFVMLTAFILAYLMARRLQWVIRKPITELASVMKEVSREKNYHLRADMTATDEIGVLVDGFNEMLTEIEARDEVLRQRQDHLQILAHYDTLTRLPNRALYFDRLAQALHQAERTGQQLAVLFVDLDHFKDINDSHGHRVGDLLLKVVATRLGRIVRASDTVARMGGDEFTLLLQNVKSQDNACKVAEQVLQALAEPYLLEGNEFFATASIGIAVYPQDGTTLDELLRNADIAMYNAKENGKNLFQAYSPEMNLKSSGRIELLNDLRHALERQEFVLYYQPKISCISGEMTGAEALVRWQHPRKGLVMPDWFIPAAEESGLIVPLGEWVLREACRQVREWLSQGLPPLRVSVNVSACQFKRHNFVELLRATLSETGIDPRLLEVELTESTIMQDVDSFVSILTGIQEMGVTVSIDDFGTGYSSLSQLKRFPIDSLKIDRSFIFNVTSNRDDQAIVKAIIAMATSLGLKITAEGVETEEQLAVLLKHGCHEMQGYYFSKAVPPGDFAALVSARPSLGRPEPADANSPPLP